MAHSRRRFGPFFYVTAVVALVVVISMPFWPTAIVQWKAWRLSRQLRDPIASVRRDAAQGLVQLGPGTARYVTWAMRDPNPQVRLSACAILPRIDHGRPDRALATLLAALEDSDVRVRCAAVKALGLLIGGGPAPPDAEVRERALRALGALLESGAQQVRHEAAWVLVGLGPKARSSMGDLDRALKGADRSLRPVAAMALLRIDRATTRPRVIAAMRSLVADRSSLFDHDRVLRILVDAEGEEAVARLLIPQLGHPDMGTRHEALSDLIIYCPHAENLKPTLIGALASDDGGIRCGAGYYLLEHEPEVASRAFDTLVEQLVDPLDGSDTFWDLIPKLRAAAPGSLGRVARSLADRLARATRPASRLDAILALGAIGPEASPAVPALLAASDSEDRQIAVRAVEGLVKVDRRSALTRLPLLLEWIEPGHDVAIRIGAIAVLRDLGPAAKPAIPPLLQAVDEEEMRISAAAIEALARIDPPRAAFLKQAILRGDMKSQAD